METDSTPKMEYSLEKPHFLIKNIQIIPSGTYYPDSRAYFISDLVNDCEDIFIHGGSSKLTEFSQIDIFDLTMMKWKQVTDISTVNPFFIFDKVLTGHTSNVIFHETMEKLFIYGGFDGKSYSNSIYLIDTESYTLSQVDVRAKSGAEYPMPRCYHTANYDPETMSVYIYGGWDGNMTHVVSQNFQAMWRFCIKTYTWEKILLAPEKSSPRGHSSSLVKIDRDKKMIIFGGVTGFNKYSDTVYEISLQVRIVVILILKILKKSTTLKE